MEQLIQVLATVSYPLVQAGIQAVLASAPDVELVAVTMCKHQALELCRQHHPDVLLVHVADMLLQNIYNFFSSNA